MCLRPFTSMFGRSHHNIVKRLSSTEKQAKSPSASGPLLRLSEAAGAALLRESLWHEWKGTRERTNDGSHTRVKGELLLSRLLPVTAEG